MRHPSLAGSANPFDLDNAAAYRAWREAKLAQYPASVDELMVEVGDPRSLTGAEHAAILRRCRVANMAIYAGTVRDADRNLPRLLGAQFGLQRLDANWLAEDDGVSRITVAAFGGRQAYIPYTNRPIKWHTDGYYNPPARRIWSMLLHCVRNAVSGGENALMDHEIAYLLMRDADPDLVRALMQADAMTIPAREQAYPGEGVARPAATGPVFFVGETSGHLHMRYTARTRSIEWKQDAATLSAVAFLDHLLGADSPYIHRVMLEPGMGIVCNNVLHDRAAFDDNESQRRLLYRARYYDRIDAAVAVVPATA